MFGSSAVIVAGGGIAGLAAALALARRGLRVIVLEQSSELAEIGAGIQLGPNAFAALDALDAGARVRASAVHTPSLRMLDAIDESEVACLPTGDAFRSRFGNPYAVIHRADVHTALLQSLRASGRIEVRTSTCVASIEQTAAGVAVIDRNGFKHCGAALVACDGVKSAVRRQYVNDSVRMSGHVVYRAVVDRNRFPADLQSEAAIAWVGPGCHLVHYPLRSGRQYNLVITFHSSRSETWGVTEGDEAEVSAHFQGIAAKPRQLLCLPRSWKRWATADRDPIHRWSFGRVTLLGDAAHPMLQYLAQGACMALEDAVTLGEAVRAHEGSFERAFELYQRSRVLRTARVVIATRTMGRLYHCEGRQCLARNRLWRARSAACLYDDLEWLYGWRPDHCLAQDAHSERVSLN